MRSCGCLRIGSLLANLLESRRPGQQSPGSRSGDLGSDRPTGQPLRKAKPAPRDHAYFVSPVVFDALVSVAVYALTRPNVAQRPAKLYANSPRDYLYLIINILLNTRRVVIFRAASGGCKIERGGARPGLRCPRARAMPMHGVFARVGGSSAMKCTGHTRRTW